MGQIAAAYDLMPESTEIDLEGIVAKLPGVIPEGVKITETQIKPVAFGLMKVWVGLIIDDTDQEVGTKLEDALRSIPGIENVECVASTVV